MVERKLRLMTASSTRRIRFSHFDCGDGIAENENKTSHFLNSATLFYFFFFILVGFIFSPSSAHAAISFHYTIINGNRCHHFFFRRALPHRGGCSWAPRAIRSQTGFVQNICMSTCQRKNLRNAEKKADSTFDLWLRSNTESLSKIDRETNARHPIHKQRTTAEFAVFYFHDFVVWNMESMRMKRTRARVQAN